MPRPLSPQTFAENPYFSEKTLTKSYALHPELAAEKKPTTASEIEDALAEFDPEEDLEPRATPITWKSDDVNLIKLQPREIPTIDEDTPIEDMQMEGDMGSFFHFFTEAEDPMDVSLVLGTGKEKFDEC
jgi:template-activating factor I